jgi:NAD(P)-dependent dehydrogenase (short-subunit alcohol dehydrogenase family)
VDRYLEGRVAIVTGGYSGIGKAIALALAERGATIAIGARRRPQAAVEEFAAHTDRLYCETLDVADVDSIDAFISGLTRAFGDADILVNSAGISTHERVCGHDEQSWLDVIDINLSGPFRMIRACLPKMIENRWGRIINIGSTAATTAEVEYAAFCASKSGMLGLNRAVALEGAEHGVSSVVISPSWVQTENFNAGMAKRARAAGNAVEEEIAALAAGQPQKRLIQPREIGALAAFLCTDDALGLTMEDIQVNAGALW